MKYSNNFSAFYEFAFSFVACIKIAYNWHDFSFRFCLPLVFIMHWSEFICLYQSKKRKILEDILVFRCVQNFTITINNSQESFAVGKSWLRNTITKKAFWSDRSSRFDSAHKVKLLFSRSKTYDRKISGPANFPRFPEAGFRNRFRAPVPIDFRQIPVSGPY